MAFQSGYVLERIIDRAVSAHLLREHISRYLFTLSDITGRDVLDMACGTGYGSEYLYSRGNAHSVTGADIDEDSIRYARIRYRKTPIEFVVADAGTSWTDRVFDTIVSFETIEHVPRPDLMLQNVTRMLKPDGTLYVSSPIRIGGSLSDKPINPHHVREWTEEEFLLLLGLFFENVELYGQTFFFLKKRGPFRIPGRLIARLAKPIPCPLFEAIVFEVLPLDIVPRHLQARPPVVMVARCSGPKGGVDPHEAQRLAIG